MISLKSNWSCISVKFNVNFKIVFKTTQLSNQLVNKSTFVSEVCHLRCVGTITQRYCVLHLQLNTTIFLLVQWVIQQLHVVAL